MELENAKFLKNDMISRGNRFKDLVPEYDHIVSHFFTSKDKLVIVHTTPSIPLCVEQLIVENPHTITDTLMDPLVEPTTPT